MMADQSEHQHSDEVVAEFRRMGGEVEVVFLFRHYCDINLDYRGERVRVGIRLPGIRLRQGEDSFRAKVDSRGGRHAVVNSLEQANTLMGEIHQRTPDWSSHDA